MTDTNKRLTIEELQKMPTYVATFEDGVNWGQIKNNSWWIRIYYNPITHLVTVSTRRVDERGKLEYPQRWTVQHQYTAQ